MVVVVVVIYWQYNVMIINHVQCWLPTTILAVNHNSNARVSKCSIMQYNMATT